MSYTEIVIVTSIQDKRTESVNVREQFYCVISDRILIINAA
jgi:hypothetical protein